MEKNENGGYLPHKVCDFVFERIDPSDAENWGLRTGAAAELTAEFIRLAQTPDAAHAGYTVLVIIGHLKNKGQTAVAEALVTVAQNVLTTLCARPDAERFRGFIDQTRDLAPAHDAQVPEGAGKRTKVLPAIQIPLKG